MIAVRMSIAAAAASLLAACANLEMSATGCEDSTRTFPEMSGCLKKVVDGMYTPRPQYSPELHLYLAQERTLHERVGARQISDFEARVELRRNYVALREQKAAAK